MDIAEWVWHARGTFVPSERMACAVCGRFRSLTHAHHVVPLAFQARNHPDRVNHEYEWLCPTHHAAVHVLIGRFIPNAVDARAAVAFDLGREGMDTLKKASEIANRARPELLVCQETTQ